MFSYYGGRTVSRDELYALVWEKPMLHAADEYGISDVGLKKVCKKLNVPVPPRGYWAKVEAGKGVRKAKLPPLKAGERATAVIRQPVPEREDPFRQLSSEGVAEQCKDFVPVAERLTRPHQLIADFLDQKKGEATGGEHLINLSASKEALNRALRVLDAVFKTLEKLGHKVTVGRDNFYRDGRSAIIVMAYGEEVKIRLYERVKTVEHAPTAAEEARMKRHPWDRPQRYDHTNTGELSFEIDSYASGLRKAWRDGKIRKLEGLIRDISAGILLFADARRALTFCREEEARKAREAEQRRQEAERIRLALEQRKKVLRDQAGAQRAAADLLTLVGRVKEEAKHDPQVCPAHLAEWVAFAEEQARQLDPLTTIINELRTDSTSNTEDH